MSDTKQKMEVDMDKLKRRALQVQQKIEKMDVDAKEDHETSTVQWSQAFQTPKVNGTPPAALKSSQRTNQEANLYSGHSSSSSGNSSSGNSSEAEAPTFLVKPDLSGFSNYAPQLSPKQAEINRLYDQIKNHGVKTKYNY